MGITKHAVLLCLAITAAGPAAAEDRPLSLHMRPPGARRAAPSTAPSRGRVAQPSPDGTPDAPPPAPPAEDAPPVPTQDAPPAPSPPIAPAREPATDDNRRAEAVREDGKTEVISVTDTPIEHRLLTGRAPMTVVTRADLAASGHATLGDILQALPSQSNAGNAQVNAGGDGTTRVSLRGLGAPRTLILLNGRRIANGGNGADAAVDINTIPLPMIERVEILKDGASAMYGADAVGGVVNLVTRTPFNGADVTLLTSTSQRGDGTEYDASAVAGFASSDKSTYLVVSGGYQRHQPILAGDRDFSAFQDTYDFATRMARHGGSPAAADGRLDASSLGPGAMHPAGCASDVCKPTAAGGFTDFTATDLYNEAATNYLYTPSTRYNVFATAGNRINDSMSLFLEVLYLHRNSDRQLSPAAFDAASPISKDSIYNPLGGDILDFRRRFTELGPRQYLDHITTIQAVVGARGSPPASWGPLHGWTWEVSQTYGVTDSENGTIGGLNLRHVGDAIGPSMIYGGVPICVRTPGDPSTQIVDVVVTVLDTPIPIPCVPLNIMAPRGAIPRDQLKYLTYTGVGNGTDTMHTTLATASGRLAELPEHGSISLSLGGDYRKEDGDIVPVGVRVPGYLSDNVAETTQGRFHILEGFGELAVVPLSGHDLAQWVELDLGARALRHSRNGSTMTYKVGGLFRTVHGIAARGTHATAFRAPTVSDLFLGRTEHDLIAEDPCDTRPPSAGDATRTLDAMTQSQCTAQGVPVGSKFTTSQLLSVTGANPLLRPETAATTTLGVVLEPPAVKGLAITADYWHVAIDHAIETLGVRTILASCYDHGVSSYCDQIHRDPDTHRITSIDQLLQNVTRTTTSGIDLAVWYDTRLVDIGQIRAGLEAQYLLRYDLDNSRQVIHGAGFYDLGAYPRYRANLSGRWAAPAGASAGFTLRYIGSYKECAADDCNNAHNLATASRDVDRYVKLDLSAGYDIRSGAGKTTLQLGINNVLDATPPVVYNAPAANSDATTYDFVGRMVFVRMSQQF